MFFRQILHEDLGCASYVVADDGEAAIIDPKWEIAEYLELADEHDFRIAHILETHNHADHISGRGRLAEATGAKIHISKEAGVEYEHEPLDDDDRIEVGQTRIVAVATPGHRPEHTTFLIEDTSRDEAPWLVLTGDSLFIGDLGRPDLEATAHEARAKAYRLYRPSCGCWPFLPRLSSCPATSTSRSRSTGSSSVRRSTRFMTRSGSCGKMRMPSWRN